ncbi:MAG: TonB-dependent receptor [Erythrobacter sp. 34-65-8]|nr:MAG: TonB-dependent receptor [Erythrobacter sp. 34-65-8]
MRKYLFLSSLAFVSAPAWAQDDADDRVVIADRKLDEATITVTATGTRMEVEATGQPVTVLGEAEITSVQGADLARVLERVPGLTLSRNGGAGGFTGVRLRGAEAEQTLAVLDGVRVADPASPGGGFDFGNLLAMNLEKLEVLRSSNSTVWGSDAIGGVVVASTSAASGLRASAEYGARDTATGAVSGGIGGERGFLGASASYFRTDGFSSAASGTEADGFEQWALNGQGRLYLSDSFELFARGRYAEGTLDLDGFPSPLFALADTLETQETRQIAASAGAVYDSGPLYLQASYSLAETERDNLDPAFGPTFTSKGTSDRIALRGEWRPIGPLLVHFGGEHEWSDYRTLFDAGESTRIFGAYTQLGIEYGGFSARVGGRIDDHARFGTANSFGADLSYELADDLRLRASVGEGFKAPTLFQLFSDFGNEALTPEKSTSFDLGLALGERTMSGRRFHGAATVFRRDAEDQIEFASCFGSTAPLCATRPFGFYENLGRVRAQGFELELGARPSERLTARAVYAYVETENRTLGSARLGNTLARRPRHALTVSADWQVPLAGLTLGADVRLVGDSFDNAANTVPLDGYEVVTLRASLPVGDTVELFGRVENLFDTQYQTAAGYAQAGRGAFVGARLAL